jgi:hypothetical protein
MSVGLYTPKMGTQITQIAYDKIRLVYKESYLIISNPCHQRSTLFLFSEEVYYFTALSFALFAFLVADIIIPRLLLAHFRHQNPRRIFSPLMSQI